MKLLLPVVMDPPILAYNNLAHPLSILYGNCVNPDVWGFQNLVQVQFITAGHNLTLDLLDFSTWPCFVKRLLDCKDLQPALKEGYYLDLAVNERYLPNRGDLEEDFIHDLLIHGYDDAERVYYTLGYNDRNTYDSDAMDEDCVIKGMLSANDFLKGKEAYEFYQFGQSFGVRINTEYSLSLTKEEIIKQLQTYLEGAVKSENDAIEKYYGMKIYEGIAKDESALRNFRNFRFLWDHKKYLSKLIYEVSEGTDYYDLYLSSAVAPAKRLPKLSAKYDLLPTSGTKNKILALMEEIKTTERTVLENVLQHIASRDWTDRQLEFKPLFRG